MNNCHIGGCEERSHRTCPTCEHWTPSANSKYFRCRQYLNARIVCELSIDSCFDCEHYIQKYIVGRVNETGVRWDDAADVYDYRRKLALANGRILAGELREKSRKEFKLHQLTIMGEKAKHEEKINKVKSLSEVLKEQLDV